MKIKVIFIVLSMALLSIQVGHCSENSLIEKAKSAIRKTLKDPYSAKFRNLHAGKEASRPVRGEVNAKNGFGAYVGYDKFFYKSKENRVILERQYVGDHDDEYYASYNREVDRFNEKAKTDAFPEMKARLINPRETESYRIMFIDGW